MKRWPSCTIPTSVAFLLLLVGIAPLAYLLWLGNANNLEPLSVPLSLKRGEYTSPFFTTGLNDDYQIEIYFLPYHQTPLDLDWKAVDETGAVIQSGVYRENQPGGNDAILERQYRPRRGTRQRIIVNIHQDAQATTGSDTRLHVGLPERSLELGYASVPIIGWAAIVAGAGVIMLLLRATQRKSTVGVS